MTDYESEVHMDTKSKIQIMQAWIDGKTIQRNHGDWWLDMSDEPSWDWYLYTYRIKPEPREWMVRVDEKNRIYDETTCAAPFEKIKVREVLE